MKKIIRLNENDLARIVKRVMSEQSEPGKPTKITSSSKPKVETLNPPIQVKVLDKDQNRIANITINMISVGNRGVKFSAKDNMNVSRNGIFNCDKGTVDFERPMTQQGAHFSKEGVSKLQTYCDRFVSNGNKNNQNFA